MFKKTIKFTDFNDEEQEKDFYFHLSKGELMALANAKDSLQDRVKRIVRAGSGTAILAEFTEIIKLAVGVRSEDGARFVKSELAQSELLESPAFDVFLMELATSATAATDFIQQLVPEKMKKDIEQQLLAAKGLQAGPDPFANPEDNRPAYQKEHRQPTDAELRAMPQEDLLKAFAWREKYKSE